MASVPCCLIGAGGTGGHLYPGLAVAQILRRLGWTVVFVLRREDVGIPIVEQAGFPAQGMTAPRLTRRLSIDWARLPWQLGAGVLEASRILKRYRPHSVLGMGGYVSFPLVMAAWRMGIPTVIHEQNVLPGLANRWLSRVATRVAVSFPETLLQFPVGKVVVTGCPIRSQIGAVGRVKAGETLGLPAQRLTGLVMGGSLAAHRLNELVIQMLSHLSEFRGQLQWLHLAGTKDVQEVERAYTTAGWPHRVIAYLDEMALAYALSDFAITRAGGSAIAELMATGTPAFLVPYPHATADHQFANAQSLQQIGVATVVREVALTPPMLAAWVRRFVTDPAFRQQLTARAQTLTSSACTAAASVAHLLETPTP